jgi:hypothetical protein
MKKPRIKRMMRNGTRKRLVETPLARAHEDTFTTTQGSERENKSLWDKIIQR